jgi:hypothetical protein
MNSLLGRVQARRKPVRKIVAKRVRFYGPFTSWALLEDMNRKPPRRPGQRGGDSALKPRRTQRLPVGGRANMRSENWYQIEVKVRDVSTCGFMAECAAPVRIGSYVSLDVPGVGPVHAQVRWQIGGTMGGMFLDPISLARCEWTAVKAEPPVETV